MKASLYDCPGFISALEHSPLHLISSCSPTGDVQYISPSARSLLGYESQDLLSPGVFGQGPAAGELFFRPHRDGSNVRFQNTFRSVADSGHTYAIDQVMGDVDDDAYCTLIVDKDDIVSMCTCRADMQPGFSEQMTGKPVSAVAADKYYEIATSLAKARSGTSNLNVECTMTLSSGEHQGTADFFYHADGSAVMIFRRCQLHLRRKRDREESVDMERKMVELENEVQYLRDFRDNASLPMYSINSDSEICWANDAMIDLMGYREYKDEYLRSSVKKYHVDQVVLDGMMESLLQYNELKDCPCKLKRRDGSVVDVVYNSNAYYDSEGTLQYTRCIVQDITEHKRLQAERDALQQERQAAHLGELLAKKASELKSKFLATMTHEIRTPINGVIGAASLLATTGMTAEQKDYVDTINASSDVLLSLIHNILDITKIESGKLELETVPTNISKLVAKACRVVQSKADEKGVVLIVEISPQLEADGGWFMTDPTRFSQVLLNYLSNAIKFTHDGSVKCRVKVEDTVGNDVMALVEVADTGIGVENPSILFHEFVQADASITQTYGGTGLGLSISKKLVELMGGEVGMTSAVGQGTTVWARIPLRITKEPTHTVQIRYSDAEHVRSGSVTEDMRKRLRVLITEDNKVNQKLIKRMLEISGYSDITVVDDGNAAVGCVKFGWENKRKYDIILMDCQMPVMNGWDATAEIRRYESERMAESCGEGSKFRRMGGTVIIALTANATEDDRTRCLDCGMDDFCCKPITRNQLMAMMTTWETKISALNAPEE